MSCDDCCSSLVDWALKQTGPSSAVVITHTREAGGRLLDRLLEMASERGMEAHQGRRREVLLGRLVTIRFEPMDDVARGLRPDMVAFDRPSAALILRGFCRERFDNPDILGQEE